MKPSFLRAAVYLLVVALATIGNSLASFAEEPKKPAAAPAANLSRTIVPTDYLVVPAVGQYGRQPLQRDAVEEQIVLGTWKDPTAGQTVKTPDGKLSMWSAVKAGDDGTLDTQKLRGGYAFTTFESSAERVMLLEATGNAMVYVNGEPHAGDTYSLGWLRLPVLVKKGKNTLLFHLGAGKLSARITAPPAAVFFGDKDRTLPTLVRGEKKPGWVWAAVPIINATRDWIDDARIECQPKKGEARPTPIAPIAPLSICKVPFQIPATGDESDDEAYFHIRLEAHLLPAEEGRIGGDSSQSKSPSSNPLPKGEGSRSATSTTVAEADVTLKRVGPHEIHVRTFHSKIDGSVQRYAVLPAAEA
ncbi:MAG TPA: hypothetical protein VHE81_09895, partial [Lacipirellulaceae bacterium]|nr:hypothetical protein [Lacipirellulaceae bacterium]